METNVPTTSRTTPSVCLQAEVLGSILVLVLELGPGEVTASIVLKGLAVRSRYKEPKAPQEDLSSIEQQSENACPTGFSPSPGEHSPAG